MKTVSYGILALLPLIFLLTTPTVTGSNELGRIKGIEHPLSVQEGKQKSLYVFDDYLVQTVEDHEACGNNISVFKRPQLSPSLIESKLIHFPAYLVIANDGGNYFAGISGKALFVIQQTGPDGTLLIYDLSTKKKVFDRGFRDESAHISNGKLYFKTFVREIPSGKLSAVDAKKYPQVAKDMAETGGGGWFREISIDLSTFQTKNIGALEPHCMQ